MKKSKTQKGITLVALIITIIILSILAVVAISSITGDGILQKAREAADATARAQIQEELDLAISNLMIEESMRNNMNQQEKAEWLRQELNKQDGNATVIESGNGFTGNYKDHNFSITEDYKVTIGDYVQNDNNNNNDNVDNSQGGNEENSDNNNNGDNSSNEQQPEPSPMPKVTEGTIAEQNSTINGEMYSSTNPIIPAGFKPINTETSKWDAESGPEVNKGLVISDDNSEFVWIPVSNINNMIMCQEHGASIMLNTETLKCQLCENNTKLAGKLYANSTGESFNSTLTGQTYEELELREPANITNVDKGDSPSRFSTITWTSTLYQESFDKMAKSVAKYKGFYVGRYETSLNGGEVQSKQGQKPMTGSWYRMYENSKKYFKGSVTSEMIWGCQWDQMLKLILNGLDTSHVTATTNVGHNSSDFTSKPYLTGGINYGQVYSGNVSYNDKASNIYDLEGNVIEWTQEAYYDCYRVPRGGIWNASHSPSYVYMYEPTLSPSNFGSRLSLYIL